MQILVLLLVCCPMLLGQKTGSAGRDVQNADLLPGPDVGAKIRAADMALGSKPGVIVVNTAGALSTPFTLRQQHNLLVRARIMWSATVTLSGMNDVGCSGNGAISSALPISMPVFVGNNATEITIHDCPVDMKSNNPVLAGDGLIDLSMRRLSVTGGTIAQINADHGDSAGGAASNLNFDHNTVTDAPNTGGAALLLVNTMNATVDENTFTGISTGTQWWGGDAAKGTLSQVTRTGKITLTGNHCRMVTACLWGSMGYDITVAHNTADGCLDVCFDAEGGLNTSFVENTATNCNNGCGAIFFFSKGISFVGNTFTGDSKGGGLFFIKNSSANPVSHVDLSVSKNILTCATACNAFLQEALGRATFDGNVITNGIYTPLGFGQNITISNNRFVFTRALPAGAAVIRGPSITGGTSLTIDSNTVSSSVAQGANSACISAVWNDFNNSDTFSIRRNRCEGVSPFPINIVTETAGANPGPHAIWQIEGNIGAGRILHKKTTSNESYSLK